MENILSIKAPVVYDESIVHYEIHSHLPYASSRLDNNDEIHIAIQHQDQCVLPSRSLLHIQGKLTQTNGAAIQAGTTFVNNCFCHLFSEIRYELNAIEIDKCKNVGLTSLMKAYPSLNPNQLKLLEKAGWNNNNLINAEGNFDVTIPLNMLLGFAEDYRKIVVNTKHELILIRSNTDRNAIIQTAAAQTAENTFKITLTKIEWLVPYVILADTKRASLLKFIEKDPLISMSFRSWDLYEYPQLPATTKHVWTVKTTNQLEKPRFVVLGFQTNRNNQLGTNASEFDHCNISNVKLFLNSQYYPYGNLNINIANNHYTLLYEMFAHFQTAYYAKESEPVLSMREFIQSIPLIVFDCSKQTETLKFAPVDVRLEFESTANFPASTSAFCLIIHDRVVQYKPVSGDVKKLM